MNEPLRGSECRIAPHPGQFALAILSPPGNEAQSEICCGFCFRDLLELGRSSCDEVITISQLFDYV
jgi:hypothetical protein